MVLCLWPLESKSGLSCMNLLTEVESVKNTSPELSQTVKRLLIEDQILTGEVFTWGILDATLELEAWSALPKAVRADRTRGNSLETLATYLSQNPLSDDEVGILVSKTMKAVDQILAISSNGAELFESSSDHSLIGKALVAEISPDEIADVDRMLVQYLEREGQIESVLKGMFKGGYLTEFLFRTSQVFKISEEAVRGDFIVKLSPLIILPPTALMLMSMDLSNMGVVAATLSSAAAFGVFVSRALKRVRDKRDEEIAHSTPDRSLTEIALDSLYDSETMIEDFR